MSSTPEDYRTKRISVKESTRTPSAQEDFNFDMRKKAMDDRSIIVPEIDEIHRFTDSWIRNELKLPEKLDYETYLNYDKARVQRHMLGLIAVVDSEFPGVIHESEKIATEAFIENAFGAWAEYESMSDQNSFYEGVSEGGAAFMVPMRVSKDRPADGEEVEAQSPALRYIANKHRAALTIGVPPLILDRYESGNFIGLVPVFEDSLKDLGKEKAAIVAITQANNAANFFRKRFGRAILGLGAVLPRITYYGATLNDLDVVTTTGHGGTIAIINEKINEAKESGKITPEIASRIAVLGNGAIGHQAAIILAQNNPDADIFIYDTRPEYLLACADSLRKIGRDPILCNSEEELLNKGGVIVSAITSKLDLDTMNVDLNGKYIIDDSQPACVDAHQVKDRGGMITWPIALDTKGIGVREDDWNYGTMRTNRDLFGCEAETITLEYILSELVKSGVPIAEAKEEIRSLAVTSEVRVSDARRFGYLFKQCGIYITPDQVRGEYT